LALSDTANVRPSGAAPEVIFQSAYLSGRTYGVHLYAAVIQVANPPQQRQSRGVLLDEGAKADTLDASSYDVPFCDAFAHIFEYR
jgi:hypothetical protein